MTTDIFALIDKADARTERRAVTTALVSQYDNPAIRAEQNAAAVLVGLKVCREAKAYTKENPEDGLSADPNEIMKALGISTQIFTKKA